MVMELFGFFSFRRLSRRVPRRVLLAVVLLSSACLSAADENTVTTPRNVIEFAEFMPDGKRVLVARCNGDIEVRAVPDGKRVATLKVPDELGCVAVSPDGRTIAAAEGGYPKRIFVWDAVTLKPLEPIRVKGKKLSGIAFSPASDLMAIGACDDKPEPKDHTVVIWDLKKRAVNKLLHGDTFAPKYLAFSLDGQILACAGSGRWVDLWYDARDFHRTSGRGVQGNSDEVTCLAFLPGPGGGLATAGNMDSAIRVFQEVSELELQTMRGHENCVNALICLPGERIISGSLDRTIRVWDAEAGRELAVLRLGSSVDALSLAPDNETLVSVELSVREDKIRFWRVPALLRVRGEVKAEDCEKWRGVWKSAPAESSQRRASKPGSQ